MMNVLVRKIPVIVFCVLQRRGLLCRDGVCPARSCVKQWRKSVVFS